MGTKLFALLRKRHARVQNQATRRHGGVNPRTPAANIRQRKHELEKSAPATTNLGPEIVPSRAANEPSIAMN
jgi:hypothetical protein